MVYIFGTNMCGNLAVQKILTIFFLVGGGGGGQKWKCFHIHLKNLTILANCIVSLEQLGPLSENTKAQGKSFMGNSSLSNFEKCNRLAMLMANISA